MSDSLQPHAVEPARLLCSSGFSRQEYWSGLPCPPPGNLPKPGIESRSPALQADSLPSEPPGKPPEWGWVVLKAHAIWMKRGYSRSEEAMLIYT